MSAEYKQVPEKKDDGAGSDVLVNIYLQALLPRGSRFCFHGWKYIVLLAVHESYALSVISAVYHVISTLSRSRDEVLDEKKVPPFHSSLVGSIRESRERRMRGPGVLVANVRD